MTNIPKEQQDVTLHGSMHLFCGKSAKALRLFDEDGKWDNAKFREHVDSCEACKYGVSKVMGLIASKTSKAKSEASRINGAKGGRPKTRLIEMPAAAPAVAASKSAKKEPAKRAKAA